MFCKFNDMKLTGMVHSLSTFRGRYSFLYPNFLLHDPGYLFRLKLNLSVLCASPLSAASKHKVSAVLAFLLRRQLTSDAAHALTLQNLFQWIQTEDDESISIWMDTAAKAYAAAPETISVWDYEASLPLIHKTTLSYCSNYEHQPHHSDSRCHPPDCFSSAITQMEVLEVVFLPCAHHALAHSNEGALQHLSTVTLRFIETLRWWQKH